MILWASLSLTHGMVHAWVAGSRKTRETLRIETFWPTQACTSPHTHTHMSHTTPPHSLTAHTHTNTSTQTTVWFLSAACGFRSDRGSRHPLIYRQRVPETAPNHARPSMSISAESSGAAALATEPRVVPGKQAGRCVHKVHLAAALARCRSWR